MLVVWCAALMGAVQPMLQAAAACRQDTCCCCTPETPSHQTVGAECQMDCGSAAEAPATFAVAQTSVRQGHDELAQMPLLLNDSPVTPHASVIAWRPPMIRSDRRDLRSTILRL